MITKPVDQLIAGDMIDLEGIDISVANEQIWPFEYAIVESVTPGGVIIDQMAIIYTNNGAAPAVVPADATFEILQHREPFTGPDKAQVQS